MKDGVKIYYEDHGDGETLLFSHGLNSSHLAIRDFINEFKGEFRTVCYDQRGHASSDLATIHMNVKTLGQDLNEIIEALDLKNVTAIGHSMGAASIFSYVDQFGCGKLKRIVAADMSPRLSNADWKGGIGQGAWSDEDFMQDMERIFDDVGRAGWHIVKNMMNPALANLPAEMEEPMVALCGKGIDPLTMASLWFSLFRADQRPVMEKIAVPFLYVMPETPLYSTVNVDFIRDRVKGAFELAQGFPGTTHNILDQRPREVAEKVKEFIGKY